MVITREGNGRLRAKRVAILVALTVASCVALLWAYTPLQDFVNGGTVASRWGDATIVWRMNPNAGSNVDDTSGTSPLPLRDAVSAAFDVWRPENAQFTGVAINQASITEGTDTTVRDPNVQDCVNIVSFNPTSNVAFSTGMIAFTQLVTATPNPGTPDPPYQITVCGQPYSTDGSLIFGADMVFNPQQQLSTSTPALADHFDVQSITSHEGGHFLGLDHSGIAHTMMYPFAERGGGIQRYLELDDMAGIAFLYPTSEFFSTTAAITGRVTQSNSNLFAAHLVAIEVISGVAVLDTLSNTDGTYRLDGLPAANYYVLALPLGDIYTIDDFSGWSCGYTTNSPPCCDPQGPNCNGTALNPPSNYSGTFF